MLKRTFLFAFVMLSLAGMAIAQGDSAAGTTATSTAKPAKAAAFRATKDQIRQGQQILKDQKLYSGEATGVYGESRAAIKAYQKANGLEENGKFDRATLEKMGVALTDKQKGIAVATTSGSKQQESSTGKSPKRPAPFRAGTDQISAAQKILRDGKMLAGGAEGKLDDATRESLGKYQEANSLKITKTLNAATLEKMGIALTEKQKEQVAAQAAYDAAKKSN